MISIIRAVTEDAENILKLKVSSFSREVKLYGAGPPGYDSLENQRIAIEKGYYYKIYDNEQLIGGMGVFDKGENHFRIGSIFVDLEYQNRGIGSVVMKLIENEFPYVLRWTLETPYLSYLNHHFYEKSGFIKVGETGPEENGFYLFLYQKDKV